MVASDEIEMKLILSTSQLIRWYGLYAIYLHGLIVPVPYDGTFLAFIAFLLKIEIFLEYWREAIAF